MAVRRAVGGIAVGGEAAIAGSRLAGWLGRTMARPYSVAVCSVAAVRHCGGSEAGCFCGACCEIVKGYKKGCVIMNCTPKVRQNTFGVQFIIGAASFSKMCCKK